MVHTAAYYDTPSHETARQRMNVVALTAEEVGRALKYKNPAVRIRSMYRAGNFPAPIDPALPVTSWRWSPRVIEAYIDGQVAA